MMMGDIIKKFILFLLILSSGVYAGVTGKIAGKVVDTETRQPLPSVNVFIPDTRFGAATDVHGKYYIIQLPPGEYTVKAEMMGYQSVSVKRVNVRVDRTTIINFELKPTLIEVPGITVIAERPLIEHDVTASVRYVSKEEIGNIPDIETFQDVVGLQPGAVGSGNAIHIRGGRSGEVLYVVDGIPIRHPIYGGTAAFDMDALSIQEIEVLSGGFNAEYGQAQSAVVNIVTREGGNSLSGEVAYKTDNILKESSFNTDYASFTLGGPEPLTSRFIPGDLRFFFSGSGNFTDTYLNNHRTREEREFFWINYRGRQDNQFMVNGKLTYNITPQHKLSFGYRTEWRWWSWIDWAWRNMPDSTQDAFRNSDHVTVGFTHTLSPKTFYNINLGRLMTEYHSSLMGRTPPEYFHEDSLGNLSGTPWGWDQDDDGFVDVGAQQRWREDLSYIYTAKFDLTSQFHPSHLTKTGFEVNYHDVSYVDLQYMGYYYYPGRDSVPGPFPEYGLYRWCFEGYPTNAAAYIQDKMEFSGLIVNCGLRLDYFTPGENVQKQDYLQQWQTITDLPLEVQKHRFTFSPRLGISHPISEKTNLYFNYGHFTQIPELQYLFRDPWTGTWVGNPNLKPEQNIQYEFGFSHQLTQNTACYIKVFTKDIYDNVGLIEAGTPPVWVWVNKGYGRARGVELQLKKRYSQFASFNLSYTYQWATGYSSWAFMECYRVWGGGQLPIREHRLDWDQRHTILASFNVWIPKDVRPFGKLPDRWGLNLLWRFGSGLPYTPPGRDISIMENEGSCPFTSRIDIGLYKEVKILGFNYRIFADILNLFDCKNVQRGWGFNSWTGQPYRYGDADGATHRIYTWRSIHYLRDPRMFEPERQIKIGIKISW